MINTLETISEVLHDFEELAPYPLKPFWNHMMPDIVDDPYWRESMDHRQEFQKHLVIISGPSRNGNHLIHSLLDNHPQLSRLAGEDSFLSAFFNEMVKSKENAMARLCSDDLVSFILNLSGYGCNKWKQFSELARDGLIQKTEVWAGIQEGLDIVVDYQDTMPEIDYLSYESQLKKRAKEIQNAKAFIDVFWMYLNALMKLDTKHNNEGRFLYVASGLRPELYYLFEHTDKIKCVTPVRPFESYYYSFAKGKLKSYEIDDELISVAWDHWKCKVFDYLLLKKWYPDYICLVNFNHVIKETEKTAREICRFLNIEYNDSCLSATTLGHPNKGNSSFPKVESERGTFYKKSVDKVLPQEYWPDEYPKLWDMVLKYAI